MFFRFGYYFAILIIYILSGKAFLIDSLRGDRSFLVDLVKHHLRFLEHPLLKEVLRTSSYWPDEMCSALLNKACSFKPAWKINVDTTSSPTKNQNPENTVKHRILHLTDTHVDYDYTEGTFVDCKEPLCCHESSVPSSSSSKIAGKHGSFSKCDIPYSTLESMFAYIAKANLKIDLIIFTGDLVPHNFFNQEKGPVVEDFNKFVQLKNAYLPHIPMYLALGNHEGVPLNCFSTHGDQNNYYNMRYLYKELLASMSPLLATSESNATIINGGYYVRRNVLPGLRIVSLNMMYCYTLNFWLLYNNQDPFNQLQWLADELSNAEKTQEKVYIIGHIAPGDPECFYIWSRNYNKIIQRYSAVVSGQFFGHTHCDEFQLFFSEANDPISMAFLGPSVTTYSAGDPAFRIYDTNAKYDIIDAHTYYFDLEKANADATDTPEKYWAYGYSMVKEYGLSSLTAQELDKFVTRMYSNETLFSSFWKYENLQVHYVKNFPEATNNWNAKNRDNLLNNLKTSYSQNAKGVGFPHEFYFKFT